MFGGGAFASDAFSGSFQIELPRELAASLLLQAVIEFEPAHEGDEHDKGDIIRAVWPAWDEIIRQIQRDPKAMFEIDPRKWEEIIAGNYQRSGKSTTSFSHREAVILGGTLSP
jgi:hypothetical protein